MPEKDSSLRCCVFTIADTSNGHYAILSLLATRAIDLKLSNECFKDKRPSVNRADTVTFHRTSASVIATSHAFQVV